MSGKLGRDALKLLDCIDEIGSLVDDPLLVRHMLRRLTRVVPVDHAAISITYSPEFPTVFEDCGYGEMPQRWIDAARYYNRRVPPDARFPLGAEVGVVDWRAVGDCEYVTDFILPQGICYSLSTSVGDDERSPSRVFAFHRTRRGPNFRDRDRILLATLLPHLRNFLSVHEKLRSLQALVVTPAEVRDRCRRLSRREAEVAAHLCTRLTVPEIATLLKVSPRTVENHVAHMYEKLGVHSRTDLVRALGPGKK